MTINWFLFVVQVISILFFIRSAFLCNKKLTECEDCLDNAKKIYKQASENRHKSLVELDEIGQIKLESIDEFERIKKFNGF